MAAESDPEKLDFEISFFERLVKERPDYIDALIPLAEAYTKKGLYAKGLKIDQKLAVLRKDDPIVHYNLACSFALLNRKKEAFETLRRAIKLGYRDFEYLEQDPDLQKLHGHPEFKSLLTSRGKLTSKR